MSGKRAVLVLAALLLASPAMGGQHIAVLELQGEEGPSERALLTDRVREGVLAAVRSGDYVVMTRENMAAMARDMGLDLACAEASAECEVDLGRNIGAAFVVSGSIGVLGGEVIATLKLHDTASAALLATRSANAVTVLKLHGALPALARTLVAEGLARPSSGLEGAIGARRDPLDLGSEERVVVAFASEPAGAVVMLDGTLVCQATPCSREVPLGLHRVDMQLEEHYPNSGHIDAVDSASISLKLRPRFALLTVTTAPPGLAYTIDGKLPSNRGPHRLAAGTHEVVAADRCHLPQGQRVVLDDGDARKVRLAPETRIAGLAVSAQDSEGNALGGEILVDGVSKGMTPARLQLSLCSAQLRVRVRERPDFVQALALQEGKIGEVVARLEKPSARAESRVSNAAAPRVGQAGALPGQVRIRAGKFEMGCTSGHPRNCKPDELPVREVTLTNDFWMSSTEVTQAQWSERMGTNPSGFKSCGSDCPVEQVNWWEALAYANAVSSQAGLEACYVLSGCKGAPGEGMECKKVKVNTDTGSVYDCPGYRLPTEAEWEYAARAGTNLQHAGSDSFRAVAWHDSNSDETTHPVATKRPNARGLSDMSGNVFEWVWDRFDEYKESRGDSDPAGPKTAWTRTSRVIRGGGWRNPAYATGKVFQRSSYGPTQRLNYLGFRLSRTVR